MPVCIQKCCIMVSNGIMMLDCLCCCTLQVEWCDSHDNSLLSEAAAGGTLSTVQVSESDLVSYSQLHVAHLRPTGCAYKMLHRSILALRCECVCSQCVCSYHA